MDQTTKSSPTPTEEILVDLLPRCRLQGHDSPMEVHLQEVEDVCSTRNLGVQVWAFQELAQGQTLQLLALQQGQGGACCEGPCSETSLKFVSRRICNSLNFKSIEEAAARTAMWWRTVAKYRQHWKAQVKNLTLGNYGPVIFRSVVFGNPGGSESSVHNIVTWPAVVVDAQGQRHWGMVGQALTASRQMQQVWGLRDLLSTEYTPACICMVAEETGELLWQNSASMEIFGCHGVHNVQLLCTEREAVLLAASRSPATAQGAAAAPTPAPAGSEAAAAAALTSNGRAAVDFMHLLFDENQELLQKMKASTQGGNTFRSYVQITHTTLRRWLGLTGEQEAHHDVQISLSRDPLSLKKVFIISQTDVTDTVVAERRLRETHAALEAEKLQTDALLHRQYQLIEYLSKVTEERNERRRQRKQRVKEARELRQQQRGGGEEHEGRQTPQQREGGERPPVLLHHNLLLQHQQQHQLLQAAAQRDNSDSTATGATGISMSDLIESVRRQIAEQGLAADSEKLNNHALEIECLLGEGSFGKVYRGFWRGTPVAIKSIVLPSRMSGAERLQRMAIMEAAISSSLSHPNIVQTYTYHVTMHKLQSATSSSDSDTPLMYTGEQTSSACESSWVTSMSPQSSFGSRGLELRLVLEYMDCGSLRDVLNKNVFMDAASGRPHYPVVLETAADVAKGMLHLHSLNIIHGDLKALNVLLKSSNAEPKGFRAKISDFGLSSSMTSNETHISKAFMGTTSHMAPEVLIDGRQSKAADVYAFGITLFELYSASAPFKGIPQALLAYQVAQNNVRPTFPEGTPPDLVALAESCWAAAPNERPTFEEVLASLSSMCKACPDTVKRISVQDLQLPPTSGGASLAGSAREEVAVQQHPN